MTCIIGFSDPDNNCAWIGGDSSSSYDDGPKHVMAIPKVFRCRTRKDVIIGSSTSFRHIDLLRYADNLFDDPDVVIDHEYMVSKFIPKIIGMFNSGIKHVDETSRGARFIVCAGSQVFLIQHEYSVLQCISGYCAVGCGDSAAESSLFTTEKMSMCPYDRILIALKAAENSNGRVQAPFTILNTMDEYVRTIDANHNERYK